MCAELYIFLACCRVSELCNALGAFFWAIRIKVQYAILADFVKNGCIGGGEWYAGLLGFDERQAKALESAGADSAAGMRKRLFILFVRGAVVE